ncbi:hypothetical protein GLAREA_07372 [Glarea lozoyensis ATCC 20868]|uniref:Uncharacterized protein n=1 Tax=Glarea lozoyensis (strain ATCC 20868 / MF5171) TaxID=1116229 RepID=S3D578_GLAL2|nr:uncharacterized protein GLAREA_07372 [Glarea lozoyensis ATCC 20868]EPE32239.1 hypothetical protein GLAREA_07372 [Glarea lozoyensis ATCC 20868]
MAATDRKITDYELSDFAERPRRLNADGNNLIRMYENTDVSHINHPKWHKFNLFDFTFKVGYKSFVHNVDQINTVPVDRIRMEALWWKVLLEKWESYDPRSKNRNRLQSQTFEELMDRKEDLMYNAFNSRFAEDLAPLNALKSNLKGLQRKNDLKRWIEPYWQAKKEKYPEMDVERQIQNANPKYMNYEEIEDVYDSLISFDEMRGTYPEDELHDIDEQMEGMAIDGGDDGDQYYEDGGDHEEYYEEYDGDYNEEEHNEGKKDGDGDVEMDC